MRETWRIYRQPDLAYGWVVWRYGRGARGAPMRRESAATGGAGIAQTRSFCFTFALPRAVVHRTDPVRGDVDQPSRPGAIGSCCCWRSGCASSPGRPLHVARFSPGQVSEEQQRMGQARGHAFNTEGLIIERLPDGLFRMACRVSAAQISWVKAASATRSRSATCGAPTAS